MKKRRTFALLFAMMAVLALGFHRPMTVFAEGNTYVLRYDAGEGDWRYQTGSHWDDAEESKEISEIHSRIKDGDQVVIEGYTDASIALNVHLSNLTVNGASTVVASFKGIDNCYILAGSVAAVSGGVGNAYVYDDASVTFNDNVSYLQILGGDDLHANVSVKGTVGHAVGVEQYGSGSVRYDVYSVAADKFNVEDGALLTEEAHYSKNQTGGAPAQNKPSSGSSQGSAQNNTQSSAQSKPSSDEYDDVPKTGESAAAVWLLGAGLVCLLGSRALRKN